MKKSIFSIITALVFSLVLSLPAWSSSTSILTDSDLPPEFEARYEIHKGSIRVGEMKVSLKRIGDELVYESKTKPVGMAAFFLGDQTINDRAVLKLINNSYRTIEFRHETYDKKKNRNEHYIFDWDNNKASVKYKDESKELDIPEHTFDNYSAQLLLMREPVKENSGKEESINTYSVISKGRLKEYKYQQEAAEVVSTKLGDFNSNKYVRKKDNDKKTTYLGWYAEKLNYLPVKLDKFENGKLDVSIQITAIKWLNENSDGVN
jgi:hypothetical protein